ncbi:MAG: bacteriophage holin [Candidatus Brocadiales bacterium]
MYAKLSIKALGLAVGVVWSVYVIFLGLLAGYMDWGTPFVELLGSLYIGYKPSLTGSLIGGVWAVVDGAIAGVIIAWVYNKFASE